MQNWILLNLYYYKIDILVTANHFLNKNTFYEGWSEEIYRQCCGATQYLDGSSSGLLLQFRLLLETSNFLASVTGPVIFRLL